MRKYLPQIYEILRFLIVGGGGAVANYFMVRWGLDNLPKIPEPIITGSCHALLIIPVYLLQRSFAFRSDVKHVQAFPKYVGTQIMAVCINITLSAIIFKVFHANHNIGSILVIGLTSVLSMIALKFWAFKK